MDLNNYKTNLRSVYNTIAEHFSKTRSFIWTEMQVFLPYILPNCHVIDIGCGNGRLLELLAQKSCTYIGIDNAERLLEEAKKKWPNYYFEHADMNLYHYGRNRFDAAFFIASLHHLETSKEQLRVLKKIYTALKPAGFLFITVWNLWQPRYRQYIQKHPYHHSYIAYTQNQITTHRFYYAFTKSELANLCKEAGFQIVDCWYSYKDTRTTRHQGRNICVIAKKVN